MKDDEDCQEGMSAGLGRRKELPDSDISLQIMKGEVA